MSQPIPIEDFVEDARRDVASAEREVLRSVADMRADLDRIEAAVAAGHRAPGSVSGSFHVESTAHSLARALASRQVAYDQVRLVESIRDRASL